MPEFNPRRLRQARERRRVSLKDLASRCGVSPPAMTYWESGDRVPAETNMITLARELGVPQRFFLAADPPALPPGAASFRARSKMTVRDRDSALAAGQMALELAAWIEQRFELPPVQLPDLSGQPPQVAAEVVRMEWGLGDRPVPNLVHLLESKGVLVFSLAQDCADVDAFSFWLGARPIILLNTMKSPDRGRIDAAHELAHLVQHAEETSKKEEGEADEFAGCFLMPSADMRQHALRSVHLEQLIAGKRRWGVSLAALIFRMHRLHLLTDWQYRRLFVEISKRGYRSDEPRPIQRETSLLLSKVFSALKERGTTLRSVALELSWHPTDLNDLLFGLGATWMALPGGAVGGPSRAKLALVPDR